MNKIFPKFVGTWNGKKINFPEPEKERMNLWLDQFESGTELALSIGKQEYNRTDNQNRWYWECVVWLPAESFGWTPEDLHEYYKLKFNSKVVNYKGKEITIPQSTARLSTKEFSDYVERIVIWAAGHGVVIPEPNSINLE